jgi:hypothetical protein
MSFLHAILARDWQEPPDADPQVSDLVGVVRQPSGAGLLGPGVEHVAVSGLDHARSDRQAELESPGVIQTVQPVA